MQVLKRLPGTFLSADELFTLTGYRVARCQIAWLRSHSWRFELNAAGRPIVARAYMERRMVGEVATAPPGPAARHNFDALGTPKPKLRAVR
jgi:hypothetical protein